MKLWWQLQLKRYNPLIYRCIHTWHIWLSERQIELKYYIIYYISQNPTNRLSLNQQQKDPLKIKLVLCITVYYSDCITFIDIMYNDKFCWFFSYLLKWHQKRHLFHPAGNRIHSSIHTSTHSFLSDVISPPMYARTNILTYRRYFL